MSTAVPADDSRPVLLRTLVLRSILLRAEPEPEPDLGDSGSDVSDCLLRHRKNAPARRRATPATEPTTAPATVPPETPLDSFSCSESAPGVTTAVLVTVWVTGAPERVTTRVLTKVVWESESVSAAVEEGLLVTTAAWVEVRESDVDVDDVDEEVEIGVDDVDDVDDADDVDVDVVVGVLED